MKNSNKQWIVLVARIGYSAKAIIYGILGLLIVYAAYTASAVSSVSKKSVFQEILSTPFGTVSLSAVIIGIICYVVWRFVQGVTNPSDLDMSKPSKIMQRVFYFFSGVAYSAAAYAATKVLMGSSDNSENTKKQVGESILQETWGVILIAAIGVAVFVFAVIQFKHAYKQDFMDKFVSSVSATERNLIKQVGRGGYIARGVVYTIVAGFIGYAAYTSNVNEAGGLGKALQTLMEQPFGPWLAGAVGVGMICFSVFCGFEGRYRKVT